MYTYYNDIFHVLVHQCVYVYINICVFIYIYIYICVFIYIYIYIIHTLYDSNPSPRLRVYDDSHPTIIVVPTSGVRPWFVQQMGCPKDEPRRQTWATNCRTSLAWIVHLHPFTVYFNYDTQYVGPQILKVEDADYHIWVNQHPLTS